MRHSSSEMFWKRDNVWLFLESKSYKRCDEFICQPELASSFENLFSLTKRFKVYFALGNVCISYMTFLLSFMKSTWSSCHHSATILTGAQNSVCFKSGVITFYSTILFNSSWVYFKKGIGTRLGEVIDNRVALCFNLLL